MADWMAFNVADYTANTLHLTTRQHGAYILLICAAWAGKGALPGSDASLMAIAKLTPREWQTDGAVIKAFLTRRGDAWIHERVAFEWNDAQSIIAAKRKAGKEGARRRWHGRANGSAIAQPSVCQSQTDAPLPIPLPNHEDMTAPTGAGRATEEGKHVRRSKPAGRLPEDWTPSIDLQRYASDLGCDADTASAFADYWHAENGSKAIKRDWDAAFRTWCRREAERRSGPRGNPGFRPAHGDGGDAGAFARAAAILGGGKLV